MLEIIIKVWIIFIVYALPVGLYFVYRATLTLEFREKLFDEISYLTEKDINNTSNFTNKTFENDFSWRYKEFYKMSYYKIVFSFWKKLKVENFYNNTDFLED